MMYDTTILDDIKRRALEQRGRTPRDAVDFIYMSNEDVFDTPFADVEQIQLATLKARFETLMEKVVPLRHLATQQNIHAIVRIEDAAPLLFGPKVLKSYPLSLLENNQFEKLTQWLNRLTTHDLLDADVSGCNTIDGWLDRLEAQTPMLVMHSSGTSGKLSIIPRSRVEMCHWIELYFKYMQGYKGDYGGDVRALNGSIPMFSPTYRHGRHIQRPLGIMIPAICGTEDQLICAYPGKLSADLLSLGGRLAAAESKGEVGRLNLNPALLAQREQMIEFQRRQPEYMDAFFRKMTDYRGRRVLIAGTWTVHLRAALAAEERGIEGLFSADSFPIAGGGKKGETFPDDWYEKICRVYGIPSIRTSYGMVELQGLMPECNQHNFHPWPSQIVYLLDAASGRLLPRQGTQRGRFAYMDLSTETHWGGGLSGDEVTVHWGAAACSCGRQGPYIEPTIMRLSEQQGGDDKISCAGAQAAHDAALDFLTRL
jgi:hypothetical protein